MESFDGGFRAGAARLGHADHHVGDHLPGGRVREDALFFLHHGHHAHIVAAFDAVHDAEIDLVAAVCDHAVGAGELERGDRDALADAEARDGEGVPFFEGTEDA